MRNISSIAVNVFMLYLYLWLIAFNAYNESAWIYDAVISLFFLIIIVYTANRFFTFKAIDYVILHLGFLVHNLGAFGAYSLELDYLEYDNIVHFISSAATAYLLFKAIWQQLHKINRQHHLKTIADHHRLLVFGLVVGATLSLGLVVELLEYFGFIYFGEGEGILFYGAGDSDKVALFPPTQYADTVGDIITNMLGALAGAALFILRFLQKAR